MMRENWALLVSMFFFDGKEKLLKLRKTIFLFFCAGLVFFQLF